MKNQFNFHQEKICRDTVKNPLIGVICGGPSAEEAEKILITQFNYTQKQIEDLKNANR